MPDGGVEQEEAIARVVGDGYMDCRWRLIWMMLCALCSLSACTIVGHEAVGKALSVEKGTSADSTRCSRGRTNAARNPHALNV